MEPNMKYEKLSVPFETMVDELFQAAKNEEWEEIDKTLIPDLSRHSDPNGIAGELLMNVRDTDPNIRDAVATGLSAVEFNDEALIDEAVDAMILMAASDSEEFPAGRAAAFLLLHRSDETYKVKIEIALAQFKRLAVDEGWSRELIENIPQLQQLLQA
jgi:hypothetical protein